MAGAAFRRRFAFLANLNCMARRSQGARTGGAPSHLPGQPLEPKAVVAAAAAAAASQVPPPARDRIPSRTRAAPSMEKGGFKKLGRLFHKSESEDSEPDSGRDASFPSPCPSPSLSQGRREHLHNHDAAAAASGERKKRSAFGNWRLKKKRKDRPAALPEEGSQGGASEPPSPSLSHLSYFTTWEPTTPTKRDFDMPDTQFAAQANQLPPLPSKETQFAYGIPMDSVTTSTLPASFKKSKTSSAESYKEENKKKPVLGKFGNFFTTGRRKNPKNTLEASLRPSVKSASSGSPHKGIAPLASIDIEDFKDLSKSEESLIDQVCDQDQEGIRNTVKDTEEYLSKRDLTRLYNDIVSEWNTKGINSDSELSSDWRSSSETIKNTLFDSNLTLQTLEAENDLVTDTKNTTTPDFFRSLTNISSEDLEHNILNHKELVDVHSCSESEYAPSEEPSILESSERAHTSRVLTLDIFLRRAEQPYSNEPVTVVLDDCSNTMDKKSAVRRSGKRRKSQSSGDMPNGDRNVTENTAKEEPVFDGIASDLVSEKITTPERKAKTSQQMNSPTTNHDTRTGSNHKGLTKTELEKNKQQTPTSSPYRRKSLKKNQPDTSPLSPTGLKSHGKDSSTKRQIEGATDSNPISKCTSAEKLSSGESTVETPKISSVGITDNSTVSHSERRTESKVPDIVNNSDGSALLRTDKQRNGELGTTNGKQSTSGLDGAKERNPCFDVSRTVTTKVSLPAKPKNVELNLKASRTLEDVQTEQDSMDKAVKINFSIANKISMFESKQTNQNQSAEISSLKKGSVSNTFVGRAKLKFGKQHPESEQTKRITNKPNNRQKALQNGAKVKDVSLDIKSKSEEGIQSNIITNEEIGNAAESQFSQNGKVDDNHVSVFISKKVDTELANDNCLPKTPSVLQTEEIETIQNDNRNTNVRSISPESGEELFLKIDMHSLSKEDQCLLQPDPVPPKVEHNMTSQTENEDTKMTNTFLENKQIFEQNFSGQPDSNSDCNVPKAGNEDTICDSPDMTKFTETIKNLDSSICVPQKKKKPKVPKSPAPPFAMPPIHEDNLEKIFDPNIFTVGLGIKRDKPRDLAPSLQLKLHSLETEARVRPKRASAENSLLLQSLKLSNRPDLALTQEVSGKESKDGTDGDIKRSRLEKSAIFSSLLLPATKENVFTPSVTSINTITTTFASQKSVNCPGVPPLIFDVAQKSESLSDFKNPQFMEKYLQSEDPKKERILQMSNFGNPDTSFSTWLKPGQYEPNSFLPDIEAFSGNNQNKINPRPGKIVICSKSDPLENAIEVFHDMVDCTAWVLSPVILVKVIRGCWILYEKPNFEGPSIPLEEGEIEFTNLWGEEPLDNKDECKCPEPAVIGSMRHVVKDYSICRIDLFTEPDGLGLVNSYFDDTEETRFGSAQKTCSIQVHRGIWLLYEEPGFQGIPLMLEPGEYPNLSFWDKKEAYIRSMRLLKMGGRKVEFPESPKVIIYEKPFFEGIHIELDSELAALAVEGNEKEEPAELETGTLTSIGSIKVKGGIWVAYEKPEFAGHQYLLEEGEYQEWMDWGGYDEQVQSLRPVLGSFMQPHMIMYAEKDFGTKGSNISVSGIVSHLKDTGYGLRTQSINVLSGVWVAYENPDFTGEQYILDKGLYPNYGTWGAKSCKISSVQPIILVQLFSEPEFQGNCQIFEKDTSEIEETFLAMSSKVLSGSWIAYDEENFSGNQYVLEEGAYPNLSAMGCLPKTCLKSLKVVNIELSEPTIALFEKEDFNGKKMEFTTEVLNLQFLGYNRHVASVDVHGGIWIIYEYSNYKGRQILLSPQKIPNWYESSGYHKIGSLRPLLQKKAYFRLRNKVTKKFMSTDGNVDDLNLLRIQVVEDAKSDEQVWIYQDGYIKCRLAEELCLTIVGNLITPGAKLGLALQQNEEKQKWSINPDGRIYRKMKPNLVLDIKGGKHYDQNHLVLSSASEDRPTQCWEPLVV
ncbi:Crystallin beta-gamma domain containing 1 [Podarcis lilfordi]|uniref:Crystallin beta-gamma domain containing 1 n=1 Tax=Podarcis lilfordi TaxID=74358 RepID=A0AA35P1Y3_9SAUR|nr:Crystallin beta-gamma domain containing 1 [Podarcis lilfordi]